MTRSEAQSALEAAKSKLDTVSVLIENLKELDSQLSAEIGKATIDGEDVSQLRQKRAAAREQWEDAIAGQAVLGTRVQAALQALTEATRQEHADAMHAQANKVRAAAASYEMALVSLKNAHSAFVGAGQGLMTLARSGGDQFSSRFSTETLADDVLQRRIYGKQNVEYDQPVPALVASTLQHLEA